MVSLFLSQRFELGFHRGVAVGEFFNRDVLGFVVGEAEVAVGAEEGVFSLLEVGHDLGASCQRTVVGKLEVRKGLCWFAARCFGGIQGYPQTVVVRT